MFGIKYMEIYGRVTCPYCAKAVDFLKAAGVEFVLSESAVKRVNGAFLDIIQDSGISYNPNKAISVMVEDVLANQPKGFNASEFVKILDSNLKPKTIF